MDVVERHLKVADSEAASCTKDQSRLQSAIRAIALPAHIARHRHGAGPDVNDAVLA